MGWQLLLAASLVPVIGATFAAPIQWDALDSKRFVLAPGNLQRNGDVSKLPSQRLSIWEQPGRIPGDKIPHFQLGRDKEIRWDTTGLCIEASGARIGDGIYVSPCTGRSTQLWKVFPWGRGRKNQIQLRDTNNCIGVDGEGALNGAPAVLRECAASVTASWTFEEAIPFSPQGPTRQPHNFLSSRYLVISVFAMAALGALSLNALSSGWLQEARTAALRWGGVLGTVDHGGVSLTVPLGTCRAGSSPVPKFDMSVRRAVPVSMSTGDEVPIDKFDKDAFRENEVTGFGPLNGILEFGKDFVDAFSVGNGLQDLQADALKRVFADDFVVLDQTGTKVDGLGTYHVRLITEDFLKFFQVNTTKKMETSANGIEEETLVAEFTIVLQKYKLRLTNPDFVKDFEDGIGMAKYNLSYPLNLRAITTCRYDPTGKVKSMTIDSFTAASDPGMNELGIPTVKLPNFNRLSVSQSAKLEKIVDIVFGGAELTAVNQKWAAAAASVNEKWPTTASVDEKYLAERSANNDFDAESSILDSDTK